MHGDNMKQDGNKHRMELLPRYPLEAISDVLEFGANKYTTHGWRAGMEWSRVAGAAMRHLQAFNDGENTDPESGLPHLAHLGCCVMFLLEYTQTSPDKDDRHQGGVGDARHTNG